MVANALSALVVAHNEQAQLADCLETLRFADEIVVVLDRCTDGSRDIAARFTNRLLEGDWPVEGDRRNDGIAACTGPWVLEIDADERASRYATGVRRHGQYRKRGGASDAERSLPMKEPSHHAVRPKAHDDE